MAHIPLFGCDPAINLLTAADGQSLPDGSSPNLHKLAIQLTIDPAVRSFRFVAALPFNDEQVTVGMLVAERDEGLVAYDIVDERPNRDIDAEGLLLIVLERHEITRFQIDAGVIEAQPMAGNCEQIWKHRSLKIDCDVGALVEQTLRGRCMTVRELGRATNLRDPLATVCALMCRRILYADLSSRFGLGSSVGRRADRLAGATKTAPGSAKVAFRGFSR